jgi:hypothetical protein
VRAEVLNTISAAMAALSAFALCAITMLAVRETRRAEINRRKETARALDEKFQTRLDPLYEGLRSVLGHLEDGVPKPIRSVMIPFFVLYSDAYAAHRDGLLDEHDWRGFDRELLFWAQKPVAKRAWRAFRQQEWTEGFADYVDRNIEGPPAYPNLTEVGEFAPDIEWPEDVEVTEIAQSTEVRVSFEEEIKPFLNNSVSQKSP